ncbi:MAG: transglutaminase domain-containing protein [Planctomycetota bacterium]
MPSSICVAPLFLALLSLAPSAPGTAAPASLSDEFERAGSNRAELERALAACPADQRASMEWLVEHMPEADLAAIGSSFLLAHVDGAHRAWKSAPWSARVDEDTFRDAILPYASISETRELWIEPLRALALPMVDGASTPAQAATMLNNALFAKTGVKYSTKRRRADQSPSESMETGLASCSGLSILLVDACRAVGVPARFVGVPMWTDGSGNHSWVEVWDGERWRFTGAAEPTGDQLDQGWFAGRASGQNREKPEHAIYAVTWRDSGIEFPMVFDPSRPRARAVDVTDRYAGKAPAVPEGSELVRVCVRDPGTGLRVSRKVEARDSADAVLAAGTTKDERFDLNDHLELVVPQGAWKSFTVDGERAAELTVTAGESGARRISIADPKARTAQPGAVSGRLDDLDFVLDAGFMPAELVAEPASFEGSADEEEDTEGSKVKRSVVTELQRYLRAGTVGEVAAQPFAGTALTKPDAERVARALRKAQADEIRAAAKAEFDAKVLEADGAKMPFWYAVYGDKPKGGRSLYISMHGGGGAPAQVNDQQWENQKRLYKPEEGVYVAPRAPTDTWNLWHQGHVDALFAELIRDMVAFEDVNPDRVYLMGYSAGGDGVYQLAPRMADRFAAAAMMAGHPNETRPDGLRNLPFALYMGGKDAAFSRNDIARQWKVALADLAAKDEGGYPHEVTIFEEDGHWMQRKDAVAVPWMAKFTRNLRPAKVVWLQDDVTSPRFYWLTNPAPKGGQRVVVRLDAQTIHVDEASGVERLGFLLDDSMLDLDKPVKVVMGDATLFEGVVPRTAATLARTLAERGDPSAVFSAAVEVAVPAAK